MERKGILQELLTPWRLKWYPRFVLTAWAIGFLIAVLGGSGVSALKGRLGADYPAFYGAARIISEGDGRNLYNVKRQMTSQRDLYPAEKGVIPFPYPPYVALAYVPLIQMPYRISYIVHTILMVVALLLALWTIRPMSRTLQNRYLLAFAVVLLYYPLMRAVIGGSNAGLSLLLLAGLWRAEVDGHPFLAGVILGLLLFKPQYALPIIFFFALSGRWKVVIGSVATGAALWIVGVWVSGWSWIFDWFRYGQWVIGIAADIDKQNAISWIGFFEAIWGTHSALAALFGYAMVAVTIGLTSYTWFQKNGRWGLNVKIAIAASAIVLIPWHAFYYDAGLLVITWIVFLSHSWNYKAEVVAAVWTWGFSQCLAKWVGFSPIFFFSVFTFSMAIWLIYRPKSRTAGCPTWT